MTAYVKVSGAWKTINGVYTRVSGTWKSVDVDAKVSGAWKDIHNVGTVDLLDDGYTAFALSSDQPCSTSIVFESDGTITSEIPYDNWFSPTSSGIGAGYEILFTTSTTQGDVTGTFGSWLSLSSGRSVGASADSPGVVSSWVGTVSVRVASGSTIETVGLSVSAEYLDLGGG